MTAKPETLERLLIASIGSRFGDREQSKILESIVWEVSIEAGISDRRFYPKDRVNYWKKWNETIDYLDREYPRWRGYSVDLNQAKRKHRKAK